MSIHSMTGYAARESDIGAARLTLELKSVNSRFLDLNFRCSEELRFLEMPLREKISAAVSRGKVECRLYLQGNDNAASPVADMAAVERLLALQQHIRTIHADAASLSVADVLRWPGVMSSESIAAERLQSESFSLLGAVLEEFIASREREGERLGGVLRQCLQGMREQTSLVAPMLPTAVSDYSRRLATRLQDAVASLDEDRIRQEVGVFAARIDVAEEMARLDAHLDEVARVLDKGGGVGKRLDFLMQELNREANTLASKSVSSAVTACALEMKLLIEQMREQVQNLQ